MSGDSLRGAIIGFGNVARYAHLPAWRKNDHFRIVGVAEPDPQRAQLAGELLPEARVYPDVDSLLTEKTLDFVDICTPPCSHGDLILRACTSGLHVFCEKPLVTSFESCHLIAQAARESECVIFGVDNWKHAPLWMEAARLIRDKRIGTVQSISLTVLRPPGSGGGASDWRKHPEIAGGGILLDHGWHHLYLILSILEEPPLAVSAKMEFSQNNVEETVDLLMQFRRAEARVHLTWRAECRRNFGTIRGDAGKLLLNDDHLILCPEGAPEMRHDFPLALSAGSHHPEWMEPVIEEFLQAVQDVGQPNANFIEGRWCALITSLAYQSHREGSCFVTARTPV